MFTTSVDKSQCFKVLSLWLPVICAPGVSVDLKTVVITIEHIVKNPCLKISWLIFNYSWWSWGYVENIFEPRKL